MMPMHPFLGFGRLFLGFWLLVIFPAGGAVAGRPNILWITCEDMSPDLGCYGDVWALTPRLDGLARGGVRFTRAFATGAVCSPARSCLITGMYAASQGTHQHRSAVRLPDGVRGFPAYLRAAGYYTSNNAKTDYNLADEPGFVRDAWDESGRKAHWRKREAGQPFFSVFNIELTHQSRICAWPWERFEKEVGSRLSPEERHDPAKMPVPPYFPDTPLVRRTLARYRDCITAMDKEAGRILDELDADGLAEDSIVFFFSDHGAGLPRGKRMCHDSGLRVPLIVRVPEKFRDMGACAMGSEEGRLVSFVDFAPTVLALAGVPAPGHMRGVTFLGAAAGAPRKAIHGARDRVDEAFDMVRSVRDERWLYIRNFMPHLSANQPEWYSREEDIRLEITRLGREGKLDAAQMAFAGPTRPAEELYDCEGDPHQVRNLAGDPKRAGELDRMRASYRDWAMDFRDLGLIPEEVAAEEAGDGSQREWAESVGRTRFEGILDAAGAVGRGPVSGVRGNDDPVARYWAVIGMRGRGEAGREALVAAMSDSCAMVAVEAAAGLLALGDSAEAVGRLQQALSDGRPVTVLRAARALQLSGERARSAQDAMRATLASWAADDRGQKGLAYGIRSSLESGLAAMDGAGR